jgi:tungstate transport system substrate-binding protein
MLPVAGRRAATVPPLAGALLTLVAILGMACTPGDRRGTDVRPVKLASTTSTANTGLLDYLLDEFREDTGITVQVVAVGTGRALKHGENGDVDVVLVHAPQAEEQFVHSGYGVARIPVMWNHFVILGPADDPARVAQSETAAEAFRRIRECQATFVSRGDASGTHKREQQVWKSAEREARGAWYVEAGQGMGACLAMANEMSAYLLCDQGTYLAAPKHFEIALLFEGDSLLFNPYSIIAVSPERHPELNHAGAGELIDWLTSARGQQLITEFRVDGHQLFHPVSEPEGQ